MRSCTTLVVQLIDGFHGDLEEIQTGTMEWLTATPLWSLCDGVASGRNADDVCRVITDLMGVAAYPGDHDSLGYTAAHPPVFFKIPFNGSPRPDAAAADLLHPGGVNPPTTAAAAPGG